MRKLTLGSLVALALTASAAPTRADPFGLYAPQSWSRWYPWCAFLNTGFQQTECVYFNFEQCMATVRGVGGYCSPNPYPPPPGYAAGPRKRRAR